MKKQISFKLFFTVMWRSFCQVLKFIARVFGYKDESTYAKVIWRIFAGCITGLVMLFTVCIFYSFYKDIVYNHWLISYTDDYVTETTHISNNIVFQDLYNTFKGRIYDELNDKVLVSDVDWVVTSEHDDSLAVFSKDNKRGYINRYTGKIEIPLQFSKAWVFSEGVAAVEKDKKLVFIDNKGNVVIDNNLNVNCNISDYIFKNGYCIVSNNGNDKIGLIDKEGRWAVEPVYDDIFNDAGFWEVEKDGFTGLYSKDLKLMFPAVHHNIYVYDTDSIIEVRSTDHIARRYDLEGNMVTDFVIDYISNMTYETGELRNDIPVSTENTEYDNKVYGIANSMKYLVNSGNSEEYYGLMDRNGRRVTGPIFKDITAIGKDLYLCQPQGIVINDRGETVKQHASPQKN